MGKSQLRRLMRSNSSPSTLSSAACVTEGNAVCGTISNHGVSCLQCVISAGWKELPRMTRSETLQNSSFSGHRMEVLGRGLHPALL